MNRAGEVDNQTSRGTHTVKGDACEAAGVPKVPMWRITGEPTRCKITPLGQKSPRFIPQTNPTPPDESDTTGQVFLDSRMIPTSPDQSDRMHPSFNPKVPGSRPGRPTNKRNAVNTALFTINGLKLRIPVRFVKTPHCSQLFSRSAHYSWASHGQDLLSTCFH